MRRLESGAYTNMSLINNKEWLQYVTSTSLVSGYLDFKLWARLFGSAFQLKGEAVCNDTGSSHFTYEYKGWVPLPEKTDIKITGIGQVNNMIGVAGFDILLKAN